MKACLISSLILVGVAQSIFADSAVSIGDKNDARPSWASIATGKSAGAKERKVHKSQMLHLTTLKPITSQSYNCNPALPSLVYGIPSWQTPAEGSEWEGRPDCFADRTCVQAACTQSGSVGSSDGYTELCPTGSTTLFGVFMATSNLSNITFCDGKLQTALAEVSKSDIDYLSEKCQVSRGKASYATVAYWNVAQKVNGVSRRIQLLLKVRNEDLFYYRAMGVTDGNGTSGNYVYLTNNAATSKSITYAQLDASVRKSFGALCGALGELHGHVSATMA